jgi:hypothetical protein
MSYLDFTNPILENIMICGITPNTLLCKIFKLHNFLDQLLKNQQEGYQLRVFFSYPQEDDGGLLQVKL